MDDKSEKVNPASSKGVPSAADDEDAPLYPDGFHCFAELPVPSATDHEDAPLYPDEFDDFTELPLPVSQEVAPPLELYRFHGFSELPVPLSQHEGKADESQENVKATSLVKDKSEGFDSCEELLDNIEENILKIDSMKRNLVEDGETQLGSAKRINVEDGETQLGSPKRIKTEDGTIWAESPNERFRLAALVRNLLKMRNSCEVQLHRREVMLDKREVRVENREIRVENREIRSDKKEATLEQRKSDLDQKFEEYMSAVAAKDKKSAAIPAAPVDKTASISKNIEKAKDIIETADSYASLGEKIINIPSRGKEMMKSYEDNKAIVMKAYESNKKIGNNFKRYLGAVTTGAIQVAKHALRDVTGFDLGDGNDDLTSSGEVDDASANDQVSASANNQVPADANDQVSAGASGESVPAASVESVPAASVGSVPAASSESVPAGEDGKA